MTGRYSMRSLCARAVGDGAMRLYVQFDVCAGNAAGNADQVCRVSACAVRGACGRHGRVLLASATPAVCLISDIAVSATIKNLTSLLRAKSRAPTVASSKATSSLKASTKAAQQYDQSLPYQRNAAILLLIGALHWCSRYVIRCTWVTSEAYSSPSIVLAARGAHGDRVIFDDYREAYYWQNTPPDAKVISWWDYGYPITAMGNRTVIVDNNTWNNTHIATVGRAMSSYEDEAYEIMRS